MRNYVNELIRIGYSEKAISKQAHVSLSTIHKVATNQVRISSTTKTYEAIRNTNRRLASQYLREQGFLARRTSDLRRTILDPQYKTRNINTDRRLKSKVNQTIIQYRIFGEFKYTGDEFLSESDSIRFKEGFSGSLPNKRNIDAARNEAIDNAKHILNGTDEWGYGDTKDWMLIRMIEEGWVTRVLHSNT